MVDNTKLKKKNTKIEKKLRESVLEDRSVGNDGERAASSSAGRASVSASLSQSASAITKSSQLTQTDEIDESPFS